MSTEGRTDDRRPGGRGGMEVVDEVYGWVTLGQAEPTVWSPGEVVVST